MYLLIFFLVVADIEHITCKPNNDEAENKMSPLQYLKTSMTFVNSWLKDIHKKVNFNLRLMADYDLPSSHPPDFIESYSVTDVPKNTTLTLNPLEYFNYSYRPILPELIAPTKSSLPSGLWDKYFITGITNTPTGFTKIPSQFWNKDPISDIHDLPTDVANVPSEFGDTDSPTENAKVPSKFGDKYPITDSPAEAAKLPSEFGNNHRVTDSPAEVAIVPSEFGDTDSPTENAKLLSEFGNNHPVTVSPTEVANVPSEFGDTDSPTEITNVPSEFGDQSAGLTNSNGMWLNDNGIKATPAIQRHRPYRKPIIHTLMNAPKKLSRQKYTRKEAQSIHKSSSSRYPTPGVYIRSIGVNYKRDFELYTSSPQPYQFQWSWGAIQAITESSSEKR